MKFPLFIVTLMMIGCNPSSSESSVLDSIPKTEDLIVPSIRNNKYFYDDGDCRLQMDCWEYAFEDLLISVYLDTEDGVLDINWYDGGRFDDDFVDYLELVEEIDKIMDWSTRSEIYQILYDKMLFMQDNGGQRGIYVRNHLHLQKEVIAGNRRSIYYRWRTPNVS